MTSSLEDLLAAGSELLADAARAAADGKLDLGEILEIGSDLISLGLTLSRVKFVKTKVIDRSQENSDKLKKRLRRLRETRRAFTEKIP